MGLQIPHSGRNNIINCQSTTGIFIFFLANSPANLHICKMEDLDWNEQAKRLLKSELVRRGVSNDDLVNRLQSLGIEETKASVESKISRGTFSAAFLLQCLNVIGCRNFFPEIDNLEFTATDFKTNFEQKRKSK